MLKLWGKYFAVSWIAAILIAATVLSGCSRQDNNTASPSPSPSESATPSDKSGESNVYPENGLPKDEKVTLKVGFWESGYGREWYDLAVDTFTKKFPNVSFETVYSPKMKDMVATKVAADNDEDMYDIFTVLPSASNLALVQSGKLEPQDDIWDRKAYDGNGKTLKELAMPGAFEAVPRTLGKVYALSSGLSGTGLFFNKTLFEQNGWNQNPKTWSEFVKLMDDIKAKGIIPITYPGKYSDYIRFSFGVAQYYQVAESNGTLQKFSDDYRNYRSPYYTSPEVVEVYNKMYELAKKGVFPEGVAAIDHTQSQMQVLQGKAALVSTGNWVENEMKDAIPDDFRWGYMLVPLNEKADSVKYYNVYTQNGYNIWAAKPDLNKKWAKEFLVWWWNLDVQQVLVEKGGGLPIRKDFAEDKARFDKLQQAPKAMLEYMEANHVKGQDTGRYVSLSDPNEAKASKLVLDSIVNITAGKQDPLPILQEAEEMLKIAIEAAQK